MIALLFSLSIGLAGATDKLYDSYCNAKYLFCVDYPKAWKPDGESGSGDGQVINSSADLGTEIRVYGGYNLDDVKPKAQLDLMLKSFKRDGGSVTFKVVKSDFVALSGFKDGGKTVYYAKVIFKEDRLLSLELTYPAAKKKELDAIVAHVSASLTAMTSPQP